MKSPISTLSKSFFDKKIEGFDVNLESRKLIFDSQLSTLLEPENFLSEQKYDRKVRDPQMVMQETTPTKTRFPGLGKDDATLITDELFATPISKKPARRSSLGFDSNLKKRSLPFNEESHEPAERSKRSKRTRATVFKDLPSEESRRSKSKNSKGLKALSLRVKDIVFEKGRTTYKEVAEMLIEETKSKELLSKKLTVTISLSSGS